VISFVFFLKFFSVFLTENPYQLYMESPTPYALWRYENLLKLEPDIVDKARLLVGSRLKNYSECHCVKLLGGSPYEYASRCAMDEEGALIGVMAFTVGKLDTVEIVAFVASEDGKGIGRFLMESFVHEMGNEKRKSAILTYIEPSALAFFSKFGFAKNVPARSLYERITSKYVGAIFMYRDLLDPQPREDRKQVHVGDRLLVMVDGTLKPRQAVVKKIDNEMGKVFIHFYFWNPRHDEWIFTHSPRIRWDLPLPAEPPKRHGENSATAQEVKALLSAEIKKEEKLEIVESNGSWPKLIKKNCQVQVRVEGNWIDAKVLQKTDMFLFCEFEYNGNQWQQDFPRESVRLANDHTTVQELLLQRAVVRRRNSRISSGDSTPVKKRKKTAPVRRFELTPPQPKGKRARRMTEETSASTENDALSNNSILL